MKKKRGGAAAIMTAMKTSKLPAGLPSMPKLPSGLPSIPKLPGQKTDSDAKSEPLISGTINAIITFIKNIPKNIGITVFNFAMFIRAVIVFIQIIAVLIMCVVIYIMIHFVLILINFSIKITVSILPFLKKKLKPLKEWPHELILDMFGISFEDDDEESFEDEDETTEDQYCSV